MVVTVGLLATPAAIWVWCGSAMTTMRRRACMAPAVPCASGRKPFLMRVWAKTFSALPNATLQLGDEGVEWVWLHPEHEARTDPSCPGARRMAFVAGYAPEDFDGCPLARLRHWFGGDDGRD